MCTLGIHFSIIFLGKQYLWLLLHSLYFSLTIFLICFAAHKCRSEKGSVLKGNNLGTQSFTLEKTLFSKAKKNNIFIEVLLYFCIYVMIVF